MRRKRTAEENRKYYLARKDKLLKSEAPKICSNCKGNFYKSTVGFNKFCSESCKVSHTRNVVYSKRNANRRGNLRAVCQHGMHWEDVWEKCGGLCQGCGKVTPKSLRGSSDPLAPEVDHILPISIGGAHISANLQILCRLCNSGKGNKVSEADALKLKHLARDGVDPEALARKNLVAPMRSTTSGYRGVYCDKKTGRWVGRFFDKCGKRIHVGTFDTAKQAGKALEKMKLRAHGYD